MAYERLGGESLDYFPCHYGNSKLLFRGPRRKLAGAFHVVLGGTETYGKFIEDPYPIMLENLGGQKVINLGCPNAGLGAFESDETVVEICNRAVTTIFEVPGVQYMTNQYYRVHPRRNDRFVDATELLRRLFDEVDFTEFHFVGHMFNRLAEVSRRRFNLMIDGLQKEWVWRMQVFLSRLESKVVLLWLSSRDPGNHCASADISTAPSFVSQPMLDELANSYRALVKIVVNRDEIQAGFDRMIMEPYQQQAGRQLLGPVAHQRAALRLRDEIVGS
jgi:hypothetical protein